MRYDRMWFRLKGFIEDADPKEIPQTVKDRLFAKMRRAESEEGNTEAEQLRE